MEVSTFWIAASCPPRTIVAASSRCAVSRLQPFGCDRASTSCAGVAFANGFVVSRLVVS
jgi:hypothetical protein